MVFFSFAFLILYVIFNFQCAPAWFTKDAITLCWLNVQEWKKR